MVSADGGFDRDVDLLMTCILAQGLPSTVVAITDLDKIPLKVSVYRCLTKCLIHSYLKLFFRNKTKLNSVFKKILKTGYLMKKLTK